MINSCKVHFLEVFCPLENKHFLTKLAVLSWFLYGRWYNCFRVKNVLLACLPFTWSMWWWSEEPPRLLFAVLCLVKGSLKSTNVPVSLPIWRQKCVCMCLCAPMCARLYAHPAWAPVTAIPRAAPSKAVSGNLLSARSHSAGPAQLLCMLSTKQISLEEGEKKLKDPSAHFCYTALMQDYANLVACQDRLVKEGEWVRYRLCWFCGKLVVAPLCAILSVAEWADYQLLWDFQLKYSYGYSVSLFKTILNWKSFQTKKN